MPNEMLQSHTTDQPMAPCGRDIKHKQPCNYRDKSALLAIWMACQTKCYNHIPLINPLHREKET